MNYNIIYPPIVSSLSTSNHRLPTISARRALQDHTTSPTRCLSTGLSALDAALLNRELVQIDGGGDAPKNEAGGYGGLARGQVVEVWGPPGVGKTAFGIQVAASVLSAGEGVVWVDASHPISGSRLSQILNSYLALHQKADISSLTLSTLLSNFTHFATPTLAHLVALLSHPTPAHPPPNTSLLVIESVSTLISTSFPRNPNISSTSRKKPAPNPSTRKVFVLQTLVSMLKKLAATRNIAILITSQCVTKMRHGCSPVLVPAINTTAWEQGFSCRVALFRDWGWEHEDGTWIHDVRRARVVKAEGLVMPEGRAKMVSFNVTHSGLEALTLPNQSERLFPAENSRDHTLSTSLLPQKRKTPPTKFDMEIPDSDSNDEDYGWAEEHGDELPELPSQWQGSEDILIGIDVGRGKPEDEGDQGLDFMHGDETIHAQLHGQSSRLMIQNSESEDELAS